MRKKKQEIFLTIKEEVLNNMRSYVIVMVILLAGIFLGVMFINKTDSKSEVESYINTYIDETKLLQDGDYLSELQKDITGNIVLAFLLWFAGTTIIGIPIVFGIILFRGFCLGFTISACVYVLGKLKGIIFILTTIFLQNVIFIPAIIVLGVSSIKLYKSIIKDRRKENIKVSILKHSIVSIIALAALIISSIIKIEVSYRLIVNLIKYF
jgi:stage II sporulation protein M